MDETTALLHETGVPPAAPLASVPQQHSRSAPTSSAGRLLREPVFDDALALTGYELRVGAPGSSEPDLSDSARTEAVLAALTEVPASVLAGGGTLFVRLPRPFLVGEVTLPGEPGAVVLEVPEEALADPGVVAGVTALAAAGHRLGLVGSTWSPALRPLLPLFRVARVDIARVGTAGLTALAVRLGEQPIRLFVEGVQTLAHLDACRRVGAAFHAGSLVSRPPVVTERGLAPSQLACLRLATALVRTDVDLAEVEFAVRSDPVLTMRVLKAVNSAGTGVRQRVSSIRQAVVLLGSRTLLGCVLAAGLSQSGVSTPPEAVEAVLVRARMCELLAATGPAGTAIDGSAAFTVGLIAGLESLLGTDLAAIVAELPVDEDAEAALLGRTGALGALLTDVFAYEQGSPTRLLDVRGLRSIFLASLSWAAPLVVGSPG